MSAETLDLHVRRAADERGAARALVDAPNRSTFFGGDPRSLTWSEVDAAVDTVAGQLQAGGVEAGASVGIQLPNVGELVVTILACIRSGGVAVPFPIQHRRHELAAGIADAGIAHMVTGVRPDRPDQLEILAEAASDAGRDVAVHRYDLEANTPRLVGGEAATAAVELLPTSRATICWTSGTTGTPKGVPRTHAMWLASGAYQVGQLALGPADHILCPFPVVNMAGIGGMLVPWVLTGAELHLHQPLDLPVFLQQIAAEAITYTVAPPALLNMLLMNEELLDSVDLSTIRKISSGAAPLDPWMVEGWEARGIEVVNVFGSNEGAAMLSTAATVPDAAMRARAFPRPQREGVEIRLVDLDSGDEITSPGALGELRFRGPTVFDGYLHSDGAEFDDHGYYRTGDLFEWVDDADPPSLLRFVDRAKDIVIRGGMNISAAEIEGLVSQLATVAECAAVGFPDDVLGEKLGVFVTAASDDEPTLEDIVDHLRSAGVASYKLPERIEVVEALPRNPVGKVLKPDLRDRWTN